jgi:hypothetical protein
MSKTMGAILAAAVWLAATTAIAQGVPGVEVINIKVGPNGTDGLRLQHSDVYNLPTLFGHVPPHAADPVSGWAGYKFTVHVLDGTEVDVDAVAPYPFLTHSSPIQAPPHPIPLPQTDPLGPRSNQTSQIREWHELIPSAMQSGIDVPPSHVYRVADLKLHIKGTNNPAGNSQFDDLQVKVWNIWHFRQGFTSQNVLLKPSDRLWVASPFMDTAQFPPGPGGTGSLPPPPGLPISEGPGGGAHWLHVQQHRPFHMQGSQFYATLARTFNIGIDHVPEPATGMLVGLGVVCALMGVRSYRRSRS